MTTPHQARGEMVAAVMEELHKLGCFVTSANPTHERALRFEIEDDRVPAVLERLAMRDWCPKPVGSGSRIIPEGNAALVRPVTIYELELPRDEAPTPAVRTTMPGGEIRPITSKQIADDAEYRALLEGFRKTKR